MKRTPVTSSTIKSIGLHKEDRILEVEFVSGEIYHYERFSDEAFQAFLESESKGKFLDGYIKKRGIEYHKFSPVVVHRTGGESADKRNYCAVCGVLVESKVGGLLNSSKKPGPIYEALVKGREGHERYNNFPHGLWVACGRPNYSAKKETLYSKALKLIGEAGGGIIGGQYLDKAIQLAKERGL